MCVGWCRVADGTLQLDAASNSLDEESNNNDPDVFDSNNMFHWCPTASFDSVMLARAPSTSSFYASAAENLRRRRHSVFGSVSL